jgi:hypothetical protein
MVQEGWGSQITRKVAQEGGEFVGPTHRPPLPKEIFLVLISVRGRVNTRPQCGTQTYAVNRKFLNAQQCSLADRKAVTLKQPSAHKT